MRTVTRLFLSCAFVLAISGCKGAPPDPWDENFIRADLKERGPKDLRKEVEDQPEFAAPENGELTQAQVDTTVKVMELAQKIRTIATDDAIDQARDQRGGGFLANMAVAAAALNALRELDAAETRAALNLGVNAKEYAWIRQQIKRAFKSELAETDTRRRQELIKQKFEAAREDYEKRAKLYSEMAIRQNELRAEQKKLWPGTMANRKLLAPHKAKLLELDPRLLYAANY